MIALVVRRQDVLDLNERRRVFALGAQAGRQMVQIWARSARDVLANARSRSRTALAQQLDAPASLAQLLRPAEAVRTRAAQEMRYRPRPMHRLQEAQRALLPSETGGEGTTGQMTRARGWAAFIRRCRLA